MLNNVFSKKLFFQTKKPAIWHFFDFILLEFSSFILTYFVFTPLVYYHVIGSYNFSQMFAAFLMIITTAILGAIYFTLPMIPKAQHLLEFRDTYFYSFVCLISLPITALITWLIWRNHNKELFDYVFERSSNTNK
jgi:hypothetical protein